MLFVLSLVVGLALAADSAQGVTVGQPMPKKDAVRCYDDGKTCTWVASMWGLEGRVTTYICDGKVAGLTFRPHVNFQVDGADAYTKVRDTLHAALLDAGWKPADGGRIERCMYVRYVMGGSTRSLVICEDRMFLTVGEITCPADR